MEGTEFIPILPDESAEGKGMMEAATGGSGAVPQEAARIDPGRLEAELTRYREIPESLLKPVVNNGNRSMCQQIIDNVRRSMQKAG